jgi:hypothetical protein
MTLDIDIYDEYGPGAWAKSRYLVHGISEVLWTNDAEAALAFLREDLKSLGSGTLPG